MAAEQTLSRAKCGFSRPSGIRSSPETSWGERSLGTALPSALESSRRETPRAAGAAADHRARAAFARLAVSRLRGPSRDKGYRVNGPLRAPWMGVPLSSSQRYLHWHCHACGKLRVQVQVDAVLFDGKRHTETVLRVPGRPAAAAPYREHSTVTAR